MSVTLKDEQDRILSSLLRLGARKFATIFSGANISK
jgi:hypothetical protein